MDSLSIVALFGLLTLVFQVYRLAYPRPYPNIPYNRASSKRLWGDIPDLLRSVKTSQDPAGFLFQQCRNLNSPVVQLFLKPFAKPAIFIDDVREVRDILSTRTREFDRSPKSQRTFRPLLPHCSLVKATGADFKVQRRLWEGLMGTSFMRRVAAPKIHSVALELVGLLKAKAVIADGRPIYFFGDFDLAAFDVIWKVIFGVELNGIRGERDGTVEAVKNMDQPVSKDSVATMPAVPKPDMYNIICFVIQSVERTFLSFFQPQHHWFIRQSPAYKQKWALKNRIVNGIISGTRSQLEHLSAKQLADCDETSAVVMGVHRQLLAERGELGNLAAPTQQEIHDELLMLLIAGHETKAGTLSWAVKFLTDNPEKQDRLRAALLNAYPERSNGVQPSADQILTIPVPYMDACMEETLRVGKITSRLARIAVTDTQVLGYHIPEGASVTLNPYVGGKPLDIAEELRSKTSQQSKDNIQSHWDPEGMDQWVPERWLAEDGSFNPLSFPRLAFSAGPRVCYGKTLALQEFRITLTMLVLNFKFGAPPGELASLAAHQRILRVPRYCYFRLTAL